MDEAEKASLITRFVSVTGTTRSVASKALERKKWDLESAVADYYDPNDNNFGSDEDEEETGASGSAAPPATTATKSSKPSKPPPPVRRTTDRVHTLDSMRREKEEESSDESSDEEGQAFYAGGSTHSGQQIIGPGRRNEDVITSIFRQGRPGSEFPNDPGHRRPFGGMGYVLGNSQTVQNRSTAAATVPEVTLTFWRDGFTIGDGPVRNYHNPENMEFLGRIQRGDIPAELNLDSNNEVQLNIKDKRMEVYAGSKHRGSAGSFPGAGQALGSTSSSDSAVKSSSVADSAPASATIPASVPVVDRPAVQVKVDDSIPVTNVQIRLADGTRLVGRFNITHTLNDIRTFISNSRPEYSNRNYSLFGSFPRVELKREDDKKSIEEAGLKNSCIIQHLI